MKKILYICTIVVAAIATLSISISLHAKKNQNSKATAALQSNYITTSYKELSWGRLSLSLEADSPVRTPVSVTFYYSGFESVKDFEFTLTIPVGNARATTEVKTPATDGMISNGYSVTAGPASPSEDNTYQYITK